jgi:transposase
VLSVSVIVEAHANMLWTDCLYRHFGQKQIAAYAVLAPTPWQSGTIDREKGTSKAGYPRPRTMLILLAWLCIRHRPTSALTAAPGDRDVIGPLGRPAVLGIIASGVNVQRRRFDAASRHLARGPARSATPASP